MKTKVDIQAVYADGSGAPAVIDCCGFRFAADFLGTPRVTLISQSHAKPTKRVIEAATRAYKANLLVHKDVSHAWYELNRAMYAQS